MSGLLKSSLNLASAFFDPAGFLMNKMKKPEQVVAQAPAPLRMPDPNDDAVEAARRRRAVQMMQRGGRASTILSSEDRLGG